jgi:hypothetical protein
MQYLSVSHDPNEFVAASSLMGVRRALTSTPWGRKYIASLYFRQGRDRLYQVVLGYLAGTLR